jgi:hypothetical protein
VAQLLGLKLLSLAAAGPAAEPRNDLRVKKGLAAPPLQFAVSHSLDYSDTVMVCPGGTAAWFLPSVLRTRDVLKCVGLAAQPFESRVSPEAEILV